VPVNQYYLALAVLSAGTPGTLGTERRTRIPARIPGIVLSCYPKVVAAVLKEPNKHKNNIFDYQEFLEF
jgi:hypothetical protein